MSTNTIDTVEITRVVYDRMDIWIKCPLLKRLQLRYRISNANHQAIRKGSFSGESVQLNLFHVPDGNYFFDLFKEDGTEFSFPFVKKAELNATNFLLQDFS